MPASRSTARRRRYARAQSRISRELDDWLGYVGEFYRSVSFVRGPTQQRTWDRLTATLREQLVPDEIERLVAEGAAWTEEQAVNEATKG